MPLAHPTSMRESFGTEITVLRQAPLLCNFLDPEKPNAEN